MGGEIDWRIDDEAVTAARTEPRRDETTDPTTLDDEP